MESQQSSQGKWVRVLGIDPGIAHLGLAVVDLRFADLLPECVGAVVVETAKASKKARTRIRASLDDQERLAVLLDAVNERVLEYRPDVVAVECFQPFGAARSAWKTAVVYGAVQGLCHALHKRCLAQSPQDIKRLVGKHVSKLELEGWVRKNVLGSPEMLDGIKKANREHVADAIAHAVLAARDWQVP